MSRHIPQPIPDAQTAQADQALVQDADLSFDLRLLAAGFTMRCGAGLLRRAQALPLLGEGERAARQILQRDLWQSGAFCSLDEGLFADAIRRHPAIAQAMADAPSR